MKTHDYLMETNHNYREANRNSRIARKTSNDYRNKWLALRKAIREFSKDNDIAFPNEINRMIGLRD